MSQKCHLPYCNNPARFTIEQNGEDQPLCTPHARYYEPAHKLRIIDGQSQNVILDIMIQIENDSDGEIAG